MSAAASTSFFYKLGWAEALRKLGSSLIAPTDQTYQRMREVESPATNEEEESPYSKYMPTHSNIGSLWDDHDKRHMQKLLPEYDNFTGI